MVLRTQARQAPKSSPSKSGPSKSGPSKSGPSKSGPSRSGPSKASKSKAATKPKAAEKTPVSKETQTKARQGAQKSEAIAKQSVKTADAKAVALKETTAKKGIAAKEVAAKATAPKTPVEKAASNARLAESQSKVAQKNLTTQAAETKRMEADVKTPTAERAKQETTQRNAAAEVTRTQQEATKAQTALSEVTKSETAKAIATKDSAERQTIVDSLSRAAEVAGTKGAETMGKAAADAVQNRGDGQKLGGALQKSIESGQGALLGVETAANLKGTQDKAAARNAVAKSVATGIENVKRDFDAAKTEVGKNEARLAKFTAVHGDTLSSAEKDLARQRFVTDAKDAQARFNESSKNLLSTAQGAEAASKNGVADTMADLVGGSRQMLKDVRNAVPAALKSDAGQAVLKESLSTTPPGHSRRFVVVAGDQVGWQFTGALASSVMSQEGVAKDQALANVVKHGEQLGLGDVSTLEAKYSALSKATTPSQVKSGLTALSSGLGQLGKVTTTPAGSFGAALGLTAAALNFKDAEGVRQTGEALAKGGFAVSNIASDVLESIGKSTGLAGQFAAAAEKSFGRAAAVFDGLNSVKALADGDLVQAGISATSAAGAILSTMGKRAAGPVGLAASVAQVTYDVVRSSKENAAYSAQATKIFQEMGYSEASARNLARMQENSATIFRQLGLGRGPNGTNLTAAQTFERSRNLSDEQMRLVTAISDRFPHDASTGLLDANIQGMFPDAWRGHIERISQEMF